MAEFKIVSKHDVRSLEIKLHEETLKTEIGAVQYFLGDIHRDVPVTSVGRFFKLKFVTQKLTKPTYTGSGKLVLKPTLGDLHKVDLKDETLVLERGAFCACEQGIEVLGKTHKEIPGFKPSESFSLTVLRGTGAAVIQAPGPVEMIELKKDRLVVDGSFVVARSESLSSSFKRSDSPVLGLLAWGDGVETTLEGSGKVYLSPLPNSLVLLQKNILKDLLSVKFSRKIFREVKNDFLGSFVPFIQADEKRD